MYFVHRHGPFEGGELLRRGKLGGDVSIAAGRAAAEIVMLNALASLQAEIGDLDRVQRIVKLLGMVASEPTFTELGVVSALTTTEVTSGAGPRTTWVTGVVELLLLAWVASPL